MQGNDLKIIHDGVLVVNEFGIIESLSKNKDLDPKQAIKTEDKKDNKKRFDDEVVTIDAEGFIVIPGFINSHTHVGDSIGKDISSDADLDARVHPHFSIKKTILDKTPKSHLIQMIRNTTISMLSKGITTFVDFREGGLEGVDLLRSALNHSPINSIILGRINPDIEPPKKINEISPEVLKIPINKIVNQEDKSASNRITTNPTSIARNEDNKKIKSLQLNMKKNQGPVKAVQEEDSDETNNEELKSKILNIGIDILRKCDGFGLSGANENSDEMLTSYNKLVSGHKNTDLAKESANIKFKRKRPILAIHAAEGQNTVAESMKNYGMTEIQRTLKLLNPDIYVHVTNATESELNLLHNSGKKIIICPRANGVLGAGLASIKKMLELDFELGIGTDNIMLNSPDMFREMDFLLKSQRALEKETGFLRAKDVLKMATVNGGKIFGLNSGCIDVGYNADLIFIDKYDLDLYPVFDPYMSIVTRCSEKHVKGVMIKGELVFEKTALV